jgi:hypothetical protein
MAHFVTIRNGGREHVDLVRQGNEDVIRARYADAEFFFNHDRQNPLETYREGLAKLTFQAELGSMLDKSERLVALVPWVGAEAGPGRRGDEGGAAGCFLVEGRSGDQDGRGDDQPSGHHGARVCPALRGGACCGAGHLRALLAAICRGPAARQRSWDRPLAR